MKFSDLEVVSNEIKYVETEMGKYPTVYERVLAFRKLYPEGFIHTIFSADANGVNVFHTEVGYYDNGIKIIFGTGSAREKPYDAENNVSPFERAETASVGRALAFMGIGINDSISSYDELNDAMITQEFSVEKLKKKPAEQPVPKPIFGVAEIDSKPTAEPAAEPIAESTETKPNDVVVETAKVETPAEMPESLAPVQSDVKMATDRQISMISKYYGNKLSDALSNMGVANVESLTFDMASEIIEQMVSGG